MFDNVSLTEPSCSGDYALCYTHILIFIIYHSQSLRVVLCVTVDPPLGYQYMYSLFAGLLTGILSAPSVEHSFHSAHTIAPTQRASLKLRIRAQTTEASYTYKPIGLHSWISSKLLNK